MSSLRVLDNINTLADKTGIRSRVLQEIVEIAVENEIKKLILFGSRARGDYKERSDIDLAFAGGNGNCFTIQIDEETHTLLKFDIVNLDKPMQQELREEILKEGIIVYEKI